MNTLNTSTPMGQQEHSQGNTLGIDIPHIRAL